MKSLQRSLALLLSLLLLTVSIGQAQAAIISNTQFIQQNQHVYEKESLMQLVSRNDVQQQLLGWGVGPADIENRINSMTSQEIAQLHQQMSELPAGGDALGLIVLIFLVFVFTDVIGATDIFPFIHPVK